MRGSIDDPACISVGVGVTAFFQLATAALQLAMLGSGRPGPRRFVFKHKLLSRRVSCVQPSNAISPPFNFLHVVAGYHAIALAHPLGVSELLPICIWQLALCSVD